VGSGANGAGSTAGPLSGVCRLHSLALFTALQESGQRRGVPTEPP
jgi:hypothetical protein